MKIEMRLSDKDGVIKRNLKWKWRTTSLTIGEYKMRKNFFFFFKCSEKIKFFEKVFESKFEIGKKEMG